MKVSLICVLGIAVFVGFGEGITWIIQLVVAAVVLAAGVWLLSRLTNMAPVLHGHGDTRRRAKKHEERHQKVFHGEGGKGGYYRVKETAAGFEGRFYPGRNWKQLPATSKAAVYMAGAIGEDGQFCRDDLKAVAGLGVSPSEAERIARSHL